MFYYTCILNTVGNIGFTFLSQKFNFTVEISALSFLDIRIEFQRCYGFRTWTYILDYFVLNLLIIIYLIITKTIITFY